MRVQEAEKLIHKDRDSWVRLQNVRRVSGGLRLSFSVHKGKRGKKTNVWDVSAAGFMRL
jgi:hypothetical protein